MNGCAVCNDAGSKRNPVTAYHEMGPAGGFEEPIQLCRSCLREREVASWTMRGQKGLKIHNALQTHGSTLRTRYAYLEEPAAIHLVRLRHDWIMGHVLAPQD